MTKLVFLRALVVVTCISTRERARTAQNSTRAYLPIQQRPNEQWCHFRTFSSLELFLLRAECSFMEGAGVYPQRPGFLRETTLDVGANELWRFLRQSEPGDV